MIRTVDTDVAVLGVLFHKLELTELWLSFDTGKNYRYIPTHTIAENFASDKSSCLPLFHAITGCDQVSFFAGRGKKMAWNTWKLMLKPVIVGHSHY